MSIGKQNTEWRWPSMATIHTKAIRSDSIIINMSLYWHSQLATIKWFKSHCSPFHQACSLWAASFHPSPPPNPLLLQHEQLSGSLKIPVLPLHFAWLCKLQVMVTSRVHNAISTVIVHSHAVSNCSRHTAGCIMCAIQTCHLNTLHSPLKLFPS